MNVYSTLIHNHTVQLSKARATAQNSLTIQCVLLYNMGLIFTSRKETVNTKISVDFVPFLNCIFRGKGFIAKCQF